MSESKKGEPTEDKVASPFFGFRTPDSLWTQLKPKNWP